jgi:predicted dehydrogenase
MIEASKSEGKKKILKYGMVGGGPESFIGAVHRASIGLNGEGVLVAGCFSKDTDKNKRAGEDLGLDS